MLNAQEDGAPVQPGVAAKAQGHIKGTVDPYLSTGWIGPVSKSAWMEGGASDRHLGGLATG